ncbi:GATOR complex protein [Trichinella spiralis]|uniref:GATOR complex protein n=1 Tax=Trichinella spiralis TaxID=6334 RepID=A0ABR3K4T2_TRISP
MAELMSMSDVDHQVVEKQPVDRKAFSPEDVAEMLVAQAGKQKWKILFQNGKKRIALSHCSSSGNNRRCSTISQSRVLLATVVQQNASNFIHLSADGSVNCLFLSSN